MFRADSQLARPSATALASAYDAAGDAKPTTSAGPAPFNLSRSPPSQIGEILSYVKLGPAGGRRRPPSARPSTDEEVHTVRELCRGLPAAVPSCCEHCGVAACPSSRATYTDKLAQMAPPEDAPRALALYAAGRCRSPARLLEQRPQTCRTSRSARREGSAASARAFISAARSIRRSPLAHYTPDRGCAIMAHHSARTPRLHARLPRGHGRLQTVATAAEVFAVRAGPG
jgi:hypothetical protein